jgi:hypothetical protein
MSTLFTGYTCETMLLVGSRAFTGAAKVFSRYRAAQPVTTLESLSTGCFRPGHLGTSAAHPMRAWFVSPNRIAGHGTCSAQGYARRADLVHRPCRDRSVGRTWGPSRDVAPRKGTEVQVLRPRSSRLDPDRAGDERRRLPERVRGVSARHRRHRLRVEFLEGPDSTIVTPRANRGADISRSGHSERSDQPPGPQIPVDAEEK